MASTIKRTNPGDAANIFVRCMLSDLSDMLGGCSKEDIDKTIKFNLNGEDYPMLL